MTTKFIRGHRRELRVAPGVASLVIISGLLCGSAAINGEASGNDRSAMEAFCVSCHEMNDYVLPEYERSTHYRAAGDRASCVDCHVPRDFPEKAVKHLSASPMLYHHYAGTIGTRAKFDNKRQVLAERVWAEMKATNGRECRNCHGFGSIRITPENGQSVMWHRRALAKGKTCMDCHRGIAHDLPAADQQPSGK